MEERQLMKDGLGPEAIRRIALSFKYADPTFATEKFCERALAGLDRLELRDRVRHVVKVLHPFLPADFKTAARILEKLPGVWAHGDLRDSMRGIAAWPVIDYVGEHGLQQPRVALPLLKKLTPLFSAEFAIRPFLAQHSDITLDFLEGWVYDDDPHVRRLVAEGTRPRLPWGERVPALVADPSPILPLLEELKDDPEVHVRRSVVNNLIDIAKDHPKVVTEVCARWVEWVTEERAWVVQGALRALASDRNQEALRILAILGT